MTEKPLAVAIAALIKDNRILLIKRKRGDYPGMLGLPGGKIEKNEHLNETAVREILEETGIESEFKEYLGIVSEHLTENNQILQHFLLHICELEPKTTEILNDSEGTSEWILLKELEKIREKIIPSDFLIIEKIVNNRHSKEAKKHYNCIMEKNGNQYFLKKFL